ncbi:MAG TPA: hypothetical protein QGF58_02080 [Myxococcota bacterium]|nr:hypothetical protein [Myxococcota bacterium]
MSTLLLLACTETNLAPIERPRPPARPDRSEDTGGVDGFDTGTPETDDTDDTDEPDTDTDVPIDDDCWDEHFEPQADISDLKAGFSAGNARSMLEELFDRRFQSAAHLIDAQSHDPYIDIFTETSSWGVFVDSLGTVVHETVHGWDYENSLGGSGGYFRYWFLRDLKPQTPWYDGFARSRIYDRVEGDATSLYYLYLTGQQGTYGWVELLDETNCYVNGLGALTVVAEDMPWGTSAVDGPTAFLYFIALYIEEAKEEEPAVYARISEPPFQDVVRDLWLRTHFFLSWADHEPKLSVEGERIKELMYAKEHVIEDYLGVGLDGHCLE